VAPVSRQDDTYAGPGDVPKPDEWDETLAPGNLVQISERMQTLPFGGAGTLVRRIDGDWAGCFVQLPIAGAVKTPESC